MHEAEQFKLTQIGELNRFVQRMGPVNRVIGIGIWEPGIGT